MTHKNMEVKFTLNDSSKIEFKENKSMDISYFKDNPFFKISGARFCSLTIAVILYGKKSFYQHGSPNIHLPYANNKDFLLLISKGFEKYFSQISDGEVSQVIIGHEHDCDNQCYFQVVIKIQNKVFKSIRPGTLNISSTQFPEAEGFTFFFCKQKFTKKNSGKNFMTNSKNTYYFLHENCKEETSEVDKKDFTGNKRKREKQKKKKNEKNLTNWLTGFSKSEEKIEYNLTPQLHLILQPRDNFQWNFDINSDVFNQYELVKKWFFVYCRPENIRRKALLLYSEETLGCLEFARSLVNERKYYKILNNQFQTEYSGKDPRLLIIDDLTGLNEETQEKLNKILMGDYEGLNLPCIIITKNLNFVVMLYKNDLFNKRIIFQQIKKDMSSMSCVYNECFFSKELQEQLYKK